jgi:hypothetical protein
MLRCYVVHRRCKIASAMQLHFPSRTGVAIAAVLTAVFCQFALGQETQSNAARGPEASKGLPPRATPGDYQAHAQAGKVTVAAEFDGHSVPDPQSALKTEDFVVVEVGLFGPPDTNLRLSYSDFSLRINGKKTPSPAQAYALVFKSLKDPEYVAPDTPVASKSKGGIGTGGDGQSDSSALPPIVHIPIGVTRGWEQKVQKASLPEGDRPLPQAGLIFFEHRGKANSLELIYNGPAGKATIALQP